MTVVECNAGLATILPMSFVAMTWIDAGECQKQMWNGELNLAQIN